MKEADINKTAIISRLKAYRERNGARAYANCECGKRARYMTNVTEWGFDLACVVCGAPVAVEYRPGINQYQTCGKSFVKSRKRKK